MPLCASVYLSSLQLGARYNTLFQTRGLVISRTGKLVILSPMQRGSPDLQNLK